MSDKQAATIKILDREYQIACSNEERTQLLAAADYLDEQMRSLRAGGSIVGAEKIAVITALNITNDLLQARERESQLNATVGDRLEALRNKVDEALAS